MTIEAAFEKYWESVIARDPKIRQYPKSFKAQLSEAFNEGYKAGSTARDVERDAHGGN
jgi:hypothetical protein